jgi:AraC-like DNA-binding protein
MIGCGTNTFTDPDGLSAQLPDLKINLVLTGSESFRTQVVWATLPRLRLMRVEERKARVAFVSPAADMSFLWFALRSDPPLFCNGVPLNRGEIVFHSSGERFHQRTEGMAHWGLISLKSDDLALYSRTLLGAGAMPLHRGALLRPAKRSISDVLRLHRQACRLVEDRPHLMAHSEVARALEQDLIGALVNALATADVINHVERRRRHAAIMARFEQVLGSEAHRQLSMLELCNAVGVPQRTLRVCCEEFLGRSPIEYGRLHRVTLAYSALARADRGIPSVATVAKRFGFSEPGRFAALYRSTFGELPSVTLRRRSSAGLLSNSAEFA